MLFNILNIIREDKGQLSIEYLFIFIISLILILSLILPFVSNVFDYTFDVSNSYTTKAELSQIANGINYVYASGSGSRRTVFVNMAENTEVYIYNQNNKAYLIASKVLSDNNTKEIIVETEKTDINSNLFLYKGFNKVIIEWRDNSSNINVYRA